MLNTDSFDFTLPFSGARVRTDKGGGYTLYLLETSTDGFTEHIHKYESGCYYKCDSRILYKID